MAVFGRVCTAMATPFLEDESLDEAGCAKLARHLVDHGTETLVLVGTTGESPTLTLDECVRLVEVVRAEVGAEPTILLGTGTNATATTVARTRAAHDLPIDGVLVVSPYYNRPDHAGMLAHFRAAAAATDKPVLLYDVPGRTACEIQARTLVELAQVDNIVGVKDAAGNLSKTAEVVALTAGAPGGFEVYCGADELNLPMLAVGAVGLVSVAAHLVGDQLARMCALVDTDLAEARAIHARLLPLHQALFLAPSPAPLKAGLELLGIPAGPVRGPLVAASDDVVAIMRAALVHAGVLDG